MNLKRNAIWVLILGIVVLLMGIMPIVSLSIYMYTAQPGSIGIIGGADGPTAIFLTERLLHEWPVTVMFILLGISLIVSAAFCLLFSKTVTAHCSFKTSAVALSLSAIGGLGLVCVLMWCSIVAFSEMSKHPIAYPVSVLLGIFCFFAFIILLALYIKVRKINWSMKGIIIDILTSVVYLPTFFLIFTYIYEIIT